MGQGVMFLLGRIKFYAMAALGVMSAIAIAYIKGKSAGASRVREKAQEKRIDDLLTAREVENEIDSLGDADLLRRSSKWVREGDGE